MIHPLLQITGWCALCVLAIVGYGTYRCKATAFQDPLTFALAPPPFDKYLDGWGISHFTFFLILAYFYPAQWWFIWIAGVVWEIFEYSVKDHPFYLSRCTYSMDTDQGGWWYGRWQDIVMNSLGILCGLALTKL
jgi:hypothetical protein